MSKSCPNDAGQKPGTSSGGRAALPRLQGRTHLCPGCFKDVPDGVPMQAFTKERHYACYHATYHREVRWHRECWDRAQVEHEQHLREAEAKNALLMAEAMRRTA
jgi:hypothetical protein